MTFDGVLYHLIFDLPCTVIGAGLDPGILWWNDATGSWDALALVGADSSTSFIFDPLGQVYDAVVLTDQISTLSPNSGAWALGRQVGT